jgi:hypothetical protein
MTDRCGGRSESGTATMGHGTLARGSDGKMPGPDRRDD